MSLSTVKGYLTHLQNGYRNGWKNKKLTRSSKCTKTGHAVGRLTRVGTQTMVATAHLAKKLGLAMVKGAAHAGRKIAQGTVYAGPKVVAAGKKTAQVTINLIKECAFVVAARCYGV